MPVLKQSGRAAPAGHKIMKKGKDIAAEWAQIAPALHLPDEAPFRTPEGYFEALPSLVMQRIREAENAAGEDADITSILSGLPKQMPFTTTAPGYFSQLSSQVMARIQQEEAADSLEEAREIDQILQGLPKAMPFTPAPSPYFEQLSSQVMARIQQQEARKVVKMPTRKPLLKWAMAACMVGVLATGSVFFFRQGSSPLDTQLNNISDQEIVDYLQTHTDEFDNETVYASVDATPAATKDQQEKAQVADVPAEDIQHYLETTDL